MKRKSGKKVKVVKGTSSAVLLSILIHAGLFLLAGMFVVFTVVKSKEVEFEPPKAVERPKMKLKKPKVKVKKSSKPKPTTRIVTKVQKASMPDIQLPEMSGMSEGLGGGIGGFDIMPDLGEMTIFGGGQTIGNDFVGTFYDFKRDRKGNFISMDKLEFADKLTAFVKGGWKASNLARYYRSPKKLYATCFMIPPMPSSLGPRAFGEDTGGWTWVVLYKGKLVYPEDIRIRFWGFGDDILLVRVNGKLVLNANYHRDGEATYITLIGGKWDSTSSDDTRFYYGSGKARVGDWIDLKAGEALDMEVLIGEVPGGTFCSMLAVQVDGVEYPRNGQGGPILPMFASSEPSRDFLDMVYANLVPGEVSLTNGPIFRDYMVSVATSQVAEVVGENISEPAEKDSKFRDWTLAKGKQFEAEYVSTVGGKVVLKNSRGKILRVPLAQFSEEDRVYIELENPPEFDINFIKLSKNQPNRYPSSPFIDSEQPRVNDFTFGARVKQRSSGDYNHELTIEYFAIGKESSGKRYVLLDRQSSSFIPLNEKGRSYSFTGEPVELVEYNYADRLNGVRSDGNLIVITDERGQIIQHSSSKAWLWDHLENLRKLPVGAYMDKSCTRVFPTQPKSTRW